MTDKEFLEKYPNCPNPNHYPISAEFYLKMLKYVEERKKPKETCNDL